MDSEQRARLEAIGRTDAEYWMRRHAKRSTVKRLADPCLRSELKVELDAYRGWFGWLQSEYQDVSEASELLSKLNVPQDQKHAWSVGFERKAIEIAQKRMGWA